MCNWSKSVTEQKHRLYVNVMVKPTFHKDVDYSFISEEEKKYKSSRELYTIFFLTKNQGLSDMGIYDWAKKLGFSGYDGYTPDAIVRSNIYRWNDMVITATTGGLFCSEDRCNKKCIYGYEKSKPSTCSKHKVSGMIKVVEERLVKHKKELGASKGKFYFDEDFAKKVFPNANPPRTMAARDAAPGTIAPSLLLKPQEFDEDVDYEADGDYEEEEEEDVVEQPTLSAGSHLRQFQPQTESVLNDFANDFLSMNETTTSFYPPPIMQPTSSSIPPMFIPDHNQFLRGRNGESQLMSNPLLQQQWNMMLFMNPYMWTFPMQWMYSMMPHYIHMLQQQQQQQQQHQHMSRKLSGLQNLSQSTLPASSLPQNSNWHLPVLGTSPSPLDPSQQMNQHYMNNMRSSDRPMHNEAQNTHSSLDDELLQLLNGANTTSNSHPSSTNEQSKPSQLEDSAKTNRNGDDMFDSVLTSVSGEAMFNGNDMFLGNPLFDDMLLDFNDVFRDD